MSGRLDRAGGARATLRFRLRCLAAVIVVRAALHVTSYRRINRWLPRAAGRPESRFYARQVALCVRGVARFVPGASCLTQALAAQFILARAGHRARIRIGVERTEIGQFAAHAWLMCEGRAVLGGIEPAPDRYTLITELG